VAYDEGLAIRLRDILGEEAGLAERKMFGGLAILLDGHMAAGSTGTTCWSAPIPGSRTSCWPNPAPAHST
jgi:hypothetical protein